jgi:Ni,Fe-hydrogenase III small subunit
MNRKERQKRIQDSLNYPNINNEQHSMTIRHLDCGSCNACELELNALANPIYDVEKFGIRFEPSPRHADILVMTGPYTRGLHEAAQLTLAAMPMPRIVTIGDCANEHGFFKHSYAVMDPPMEIKDAIICHIPGCPPSPLVLLEALLQLARRFSRSHYSVLK